MPLKTKLEWQNNYDVANVHRLLIYNAPNWMGLGEYSIDRVVITSGVWIVLEITIPDSLQEPWLQAIQVKSYNPNIGSYTFIPTTLTGMSLDDYYDDHTSLWIYPPGKKGEEVKA